MESISTLAIIRTEDKGTEMGGGLGMDLQVLVATMNQREYSLPEKMNIRSDAIIGNQCDRNEVIEINCEGYRIKYLSFAETGVGLNRNNALMRATADICVLADDDQIFVDGYEEVILNNFRKYPDADVIIFNLYDANRFIIEKPFRVKAYNFMRFGAPRIAFRRRSITKHGISFNLHFGGGAEYNAGEDSLFLSDCLRKKLKVIAVPDYIARLTNERESTWFSGYDEKYFLDKGALFQCMSPRLSKLLCFQFCFRRRGMFSNEYSWLEAYKICVRGTNVF